MGRTIKLLLGALGIALLLSGCIHRELIIAGPRTVSAPEAPVAVSQAPAAVQPAAVTVSKMQPADNTIIPRVPFPDSEYSSLKRSGSGTVKGVIYVADAYGKKVYGKQTRLYLNPITSYSRQWYSESYIGGYKMEKADKKLYNYLKFTSSNAQGKFAFYGVPDGAYYVIGIVKCGQECGYSSPRNIRIAKEVQVTGSEVVSVDLSKMVD